MRPHDNFNSNLQRVAALKGLYITISQMVKPILDTSDILRAQLVLAVSALDTYIHNLVKEGMLEIVDGRRPPSKAFLKFRISIGSSISYPSGEIRTRIETEIIEQHSFLSFQKPDKIADAIRLFVDIALWDEVSQKIGEDKKSIKDTLDLIAERRNKIAHEADLDPSYPNQRWPITQKDVDDAVEFLESICAAIDTVTAISAAK